MFIKKFFYNAAARILGAGDLENYQKPPITVTALAAVFAFFSLAFLIVILDFIFSLTHL